MKKKQLKTRLTLNKQTISRLSGKEASRIMGGDGDTTQNHTVCDCDLAETDQGGGCEGSFMLVCETLGCGDNTGTRLPSCWNC
ncbi:hypothetical protein ED312_23255 [Sinomicrobium pectinilyticum]|uniref:Uncharacterized protein n=1 Tax=Sinomicrobium pectinilyticum TaxID=1084421 RepID=A0A3N0CZZ8_SINP1|nr:class I lanthipeptide [Sinomicrobium pectinilyticum]RNL68583.1 hypothetical protein ED312_23255 [Sinomicrobium pectinilyticum]